MSCERGLTAATLRLYNFSQPVLSFFQGAPANTELISTWVVVPGKQTALLYGVSPSFYAQEITVPFIQEIIPAKLIQRCCTDKAELPKVRSLAQRLWLVLDPEMEPCVKLTVEEVPVF